VKFFRKQSVALGIVLVLCLSLAGCGDDLKKVVSLGKTATRIIGEVDDYATRSGKFGRIAPADEARIHYAVISINSKLQIAKNVTTRINNAIQAGEKLSPVQRSELRVVYVAFRDSIFELNTAGVLFKNEETKKAFSTLVKQLSGTADQAVTLWDDK
jgi:hypothetical protein